MKDVLKFFGFMFLVYIFLIIMIAMTMMASDYLLNKENNYYFNAGAQKMRDCIKSTPEEFENDKVCLKLFNVYES